MDEIVRFSHKGKMQKETETHGERQEEAETERQKDREVDIKDKILAIGKLCVITCNPLLLYMYF